MKVIEFNGIPGCGKSTVCREIYQYFEENTEKRIIYYKNPLRKNIIVKFFQCFFILCRAVIDKNQRKLLSAVLYLGYMLIRRNGIKKNIIYQFQYLYKMMIIADYCKKRNRENKTDIILIDQGIIQYVVSALYEITYKRETIRSFFSKMDFYTEDCYVIECEADIDKVLDRLQKRKNGKSRIERLAYEQREEKLLQQSVVFDDVRECYREYIKNIIRIDTTETSPYENSQMVIQMQGDT